MIAREEKDGVWDKKKKNFGVFMMKRRTLRCESEKKYEKEKYGLKKYLRKDKQKAHLIW